MKFNADRKFICLLNVNLDLLWPNMSSSWSRIFTKRAPTEKTRLVKISSHSGTRFNLYQHIYNQCVCLFLFVCFPHQQLLFEQVLFTTCTALSIIMQDYALNQPIRWIGIFSLPIHFIYSLNDLILIFANLILKFNCP